MPNPSAATPTWSDNHPGLPIDSEVALAEAVAQLRRLDPGPVNRMLAVGGWPPLRRMAPDFSGLATIVVGQQVSTASAGAILGRLKAAVDPLTAAAVAAVGDDVLRGAGLSAAKMQTLRAAAQAVTSGSLCLDGLASLRAEEAHRALVAVKGIGPWTADAYLLFCLDHPDAWPAGDLALQEAARLVLDLDARPSGAQLDVLGERWRPYRAVAARLLWATYRVAKGRSGMPVAP